MNPPSTPPSLTMIRTIDGQHPHPSPKKFFVIFWIISKTITQEELGDNFWKFWWFFMKNFSGRFFLIFDHKFWFHARFLKVHSPSRSRVPPSKLGGFREGVPMYDSSTSSYPSSLNIIKAWKKMWGEGQSGRCPRGSRGVWAPTIEIILRFNIPTLTIKIFFNRWFLPKMHAF